MAPTPMAMPQRREGGAQASGAYSDAGQASEVAKPEPTGADRAHNLACPTALRPLTSIFRPANPGWNEAL